MRAALLSLALLAGACSSDSRSSVSPPAPVSASPGQPATELTRAERVTLRVLGMT